MQKLLKHAKERKLTIELCHAKIMFCGSSKAGKTSFTKLLQNIEFDDKNYTSTDVGKTTQVLVSDMINVRGTEWFHLNTEQEIKQLTQKLLTKVKDESFEPDFELAVPTSDDDHPDVASMVTNDTEEQDNITNGNSSEQPTVNDQQPKTFDNHNVQPSSVVDVEKIMASSSHTSEPSKDSSEMWNILTLFDTGGQPEFLNLLPAINAIAAINFIVLDISNGERCLDQPVVAQHSNEIYRKHELCYTNLHLLECLLSLITESSLKHSFLPENIQIKGDEHPNPVVCFIGTFFDQLSLQVNPQEALQNVVNIGKRLRKLINNANVNKNLDVWTYNKKLLIAVDNTIAGKPENETSVAKYIRSEITKMLKLKGHYEIPVTWFILQLQLRLEQKACLNLDYVKTLSDKIMPSNQKMNRLEIEMVLKFYHLLGVLLYFDEVDGMKDFVITDPQWLFSNLAKLITCSFKKEKNCDDKLLQKFNEEGIFNKKLLDSIDLDIYDIKQESFLSLLEYLKIVAPMDDKNMCYFMPSILPTYEWGTDNTDIPNGDVFGSQIFYKPNGESYSVQPLLVTFNFGTVPRGLFCFLIVQLLQNNTSWSLYSINEDTIVYRYDNLITLRTDKTCYLSIIDRVKYLELQIRNKAKFSSSVHCEVQHAITVALKYLCKRFGWQFCDLRYGYLCSECSRSSDHLTLLSNTEPIPQVFPRYAECGYQSMPLMEEHQVWFTPIQDAELNQQNVKEYQIHIKRNNLRSQFSLNVKSSDTIAAIKEEIKLVTSILPHAQILVYLGRKLEEKDTLHHYNIRENGYIHLIERSTSKIIIGSLDVLQHYDEKPDMWKLIKIVIPKIQADWETVAFSMEYDIYIVKAIRKDFQTSEERCKFLFEDWLSTSRGVMPKTWNKLLERIKDVDCLQEAAETIERELKLEFTKH